MTEREFTPARSICPYCGVGCGITYDGSDGATGWKASVNSRGEVCPKGASAWEIVDHEERLTQPLVREDGQLISASWETALERIERGFGDILDEHGPDALSFFASSNCTNEENYLFQKLARLLGTNNVDNCARLCHSSTVAAMASRFGAGAMTNTLEDIPEADCFLVIGANPAEQHPIIFRSYLLPAVRNGTTLIHVDPRTNATTQAADTHLAVTPGADIHLLNGMAAHLIETGRVDEAFIAERTAGYEALREHLAGVDVDDAAAKAGVYPSDLRAAAETYAEADRAAAFTGMGMSQHHYGTDNVHALLNLALLTGNVGRRGTGVNPLRGQNNVQGASDVGALPDVLPGYQSITDSSARERIAAVWGAEPPSEPGLTEVEMTHQFGNSIHGAFVFGENPVVTEPNANRVADAFDQLSCLVVLDLFRTETAEYADVVLPGSSWAEKGGTVTNTDRRVMRMRPNAPPPGDARRDRSVIQDIAKRLTADPDEFDYDAPEAVFEELTSLNDLYAGMTYAGIGDGHQRWPFDAETGDGVGVLHEEEFANGDQTAPFVAVNPVPPAAETGPDELVLTTGRVSQQFNSGALTRRSPTLMRLHGSDALLIHPDDADARGISDGETVTVTNDRGSVEVAASVTPTVQQGLVFLTFHYADPLTNRLTGDTLDPVAKIPEYKHTAVRVSLAD